jgi:hypothetical protein
VSEKKNFIYTDEKLVKIECVGFNGKDDYIPYLRLEDGYGNYMGVIKERDLKKLLLFVKEAIKVCK